MDKKLRFQWDCQNLSLRIYGKSYSCLEDSQASVISRLVKGKKRFNLKQFLTRILTGC